MKQTAISIKAHNQETIRNLRSHVNNLQTQNSGYKKQVESNQEKIAELESLVSLQNSEINALNLKVTELSDALKRRGQQFNILQHNGTSDQIHDNTTHNQSQSVTPNTFLPLTPSRIPLATLDSPMPLTHKVRDLRALLDALLNQQNNAPVSLSSENATGAMGSSEVLFQLRTRTFQLQEKVATLTSETVQYKRQMRFYREKYQDSKSELEEVLTLKSNSDSRCAELERYLFGMNSELNQFQYQREHYSHRLRVAEQAVKKVQRDSELVVTDLKERLQMQEKSLKQEVQFKKVEYEARIVSLQNRLKQNQEELKNFNVYTNRIQELSQKLLELEMQNADYRVRLNRLDSSRLTVVGRPDGSRISVGENSRISVATTDLALRQLYDKLASKEEALLKTDYTIKQKDQVIAALNKQIQELQEQIAKKSREMERVSNMLRVAENAKSQALSDSHSAKSLLTQSTQSLTAQIDKLKKDLQANRNTHELLVTAQSKYKELQKEHQIVTDRCAGLEVQVKRLKLVEQHARQIAAKSTQSQGGQQAFKAAFEAQRKRLQSKLKQQEIQIQEHIKLVAQLKHNSTVDARKLREQQDLHNQELDSIRKVVEVTSTRAARAEQEKTQLEAQLSRMQSELAMSKEQANSKIHSLEQTASNLTVELDASRFKMDSLVQQANRFKAIVSQLQTTNSRQENQLSQKDRQTRDLQAGVYDLKMKNEQMLYKNKSLKVEVDRLQSTLSQMINKAAEPTPTATYTPSFSFSNPYNFDYNQSTSTNFY